MTFDAAEAEGGVLKRLIDALEQVLDALASPIEGIPERGLWLVGRSSGEGCFSRTLYLLEDGRLAEVDRRPLELGETDAVETTLRIRTPAEAVVCFPLAEMIKELHEKVGDLAVQSRATIDIALITEGFCLNALPALEELRGLPAEALAAVGAASLTVGGQNGKKAPRAS
jgi:hypothetical protein